MRMSKEELYPKIREMPYYKTTVSAERSKAQIAKLLEKYHIKNHQWTKYNPPHNPFFFILLLN